MPLQKSKYTHELYANIEYLDWSKKRLKAAGATVKVIDPLKDYQQSQQIGRKDPVRAIK